MQNLHEQNQPAHRPDNRLLAGLPAVDWHNLAPQMELVALPRGHVLHEPGEPLSHAYFPTDSVVSLLYLMDNGDSAEIAVIGNEGMIGMSLFMGGYSSTSQAILQNDGHAWRMRAAALKKAFDRGGALSDLLLKFAASLMTQMVQTAACNRHHSIEQQMCRWMLLSLDRLPVDRISMTEEQIGIRLGIGREAVANAAAGLAEAGLIDYDQGDIRIRDRAGVEKRSCECYRSIRAESDRLKPGPIELVR